MKYNFELGEITSGSKTVELTQLENQFLKYMMEQKDRYTSTETIMKEFKLNENSVRRLICVINSKSRKIYKIDNKFGYGYRLIELK